MIPINQEWRVKEKTSAPVLIAFDNDMDLLDDDESPLIKDGSLPPIGMDINMPFTLPAEFRGVKEVVFEKPEELSQHLKHVYIRGHIDGRPISRMLVDGDAAINQMSYFVFKKLGREDDELMKTN
jgi:hypothetical protein